MNDYLIRGIDLYKIYENSGIETAILKGISLNLYQGEKLVLIGASGSGKTTLINILLGEIKPNAGQIFWDSHDKDISKMSNQKITSLRRKFIGYIDQQNNIIPQLTVKENILIGKLFYDDKSEWNSYLSKLTELLGIDHLLEKKASKLSLGETKRVNIAAALINNPKVLIADEPVDGLDPITSDKLLDLFDEINKELNTSIIMTTHNQMVAKRGDRILELERGILSGAHNDEVSLGELERTRKIVIDSDGRISIPNKILKDLNSPKVLHMDYLDDQIKLSVKEEDQRLINKDLIFECIMCNRLEDEPICSNCGSETIELN